MKIGDLLDKLNFLIKAKYITRDDEVILASTECDPGTITGVCIPKLIPTPKTKLKKYQLGFRGYKDK